jgi:hypothetical protein
MVTSSSTFSKPFGADSAHKEVENRPNETIKNKTDNKFMELVQESNKC